MGNRAREAMLGCKLAALVEAQHAARDHNHTYGEGPFILAWKPWFACVFLGTSSSSLDSLSTLLTPRKNFMAVTKTLGIWKGGNTREEVDETAASTKTCRPRLKPLPLRSKRTP